ncbi:MAG: hypothetical protein H7X71_02730, partial [Chitinophagales bacterium]|nr:hypothetical protein [Chitinophagales bacterium]
MRTRLLQTTIFLLMALISIQKVRAQIYGETAFLQGCYIEVAVAECGVYGSDDAVPASGPFGPYHDNVFVGLGFVADHEKDGWDESTGAGEPDFCGDYFTPGSPEEGWAIEYDGDEWYNHYVPCSAFSFDIDGAVVGYTDTGGYKSATWEGEIDDIDLGITQYTVFPDGALFFLTSVELCNNGATDMVDVYYMRNVDPDQDQPVCGTFMTTNY